MVNKLILWMSILFLLASCKAKVPEDILSRETMEDLLYDYHLAQALAKKAGDSVDYRTRLYTDAVYRKYGIDEEEFNHTMEWYTRNSEELFKIYKKIDDKFAEVTLSNKNKGNRYADMKAEGDTMNVWRGRDFYMLTSTWRNRMDFEQTADSTYESGDRLMWQFDTRWFYHDGQRTAMAALAVVYDNDSVSSNIHTLYSTGRQEIFLKIGERPIKSICGFIYQMTDWTEQPRILTVSDPVLVRFKKKKRRTPKDTTSVSVVDSIGENKDKSLSDSDKRKFESEEERGRRINGPIEPKARVEPENPRILTLPRAQ